MFSIDEMIKWTITTNLFLQCGNFKVFYSVFLLESYSYFPHKVGFPFYHIFTLTMKKHNSYQTCNHITFPQHSQLGHLLYKNITSLSCQFTSAS